MITEWGEVQVAAGKEKIDLYNYSEIRYWAGKFNILEEEIVETIHRVGDDLSAIREYLGR